MVDDRPGITRDRLYAHIAFDGIPFTIVDTGGFEDLGQDPLLHKVREQVDQAIEEADGVIFMVDGRQGLMPGDEEMADLLRRHGKKVYLAVNKIDGPEHDALTSEFYGLGFEPVFPVSSAHGYGVRALMQSLIQHFPETYANEIGNGRIRVCILGRPNVGKSSLINRILGSDRLVVSELPGTTRDPVDTSFCYHERDYLLIDTAGLRRKSRVKQKIEKFSMIKALNSLRRCHVAAVLLDASEGISEQDARICGYALEQGRGVVLTVNKWDLIKRDDRARERLNSSIDRQLQFMNFAPRINLSAKTGERVMKIFQKIDLVFDQFSKTVTTSTLNSVLQRLIQRHPPPRIGHGRLKFFYATQVRNRPPTFLIFVNRPDMIHFSYERFLINHLRNELDLKFSPLRLVFKKRT